LRPPSWCLAVHPCPHCTLGHKLLPAVRNATFSVRSPVSCSWFHFWLLFCFAVESISLCYHWNCRGFAKPRPAKYL
jgi:hypothetical protein